MADTNPTDAGSAVDPKAADGDGQLRERLAALEATLKETKESHTREIDALRKDRSSAPPDPDAQTKMRTQWNTLFEKDPASAMAAYEQTYLHPNMNKVMEAANTGTRAMQEKLSRFGRDEILRDKRCSPEVLDEVEQVAKQMDPDKRSEPGAWRSILENVLRRKALAEVNMNGGSKSGMRTERGSELDETQDFDTSELTAEERRWAKRWGISPEEFKKSQGDHEMEW